MQTVKLICRAEHIHEVGAVVFGQWAAHPALTDECTDSTDEWHITLVPSARSLRSVTGEMAPEVAIKLARDLSKGVPHIADWRRVDDATKDAIRTIAKPGPR